MTVFLSYWAVFLALVVITLYIVVLDIRYIHLQYTISRRELFRQTWEDESFRKALIEAQRKKRQEGKQD
jgi:predicted Holliday junction resolvase-like endonuclease